MDLWDMVYVVSHVNGRHTWLVALADYTPRSPMTYLLEYTLPINHIDSSQNWSNVLSSVLVQFKYNHWLITASCFQKRAYQQGFYWITLMTILLPSCYLLYSRPNFVQQIERYYWLHVPSLDGYKLLLMFILWFTNSILIHYCTLWPTLPL